MSKSDVNVVFIITPFSDAKGSIEEAFNKHIDFNGIYARIIDTKKKLADLLSEKNSGLHIGVVTWAFLKHKSESETQGESTGHLDNIGSERLRLVIENNKNIRLVITDENHRESDTPSSRAFFKAFNAPILMVSATPYNEIIKGFANEINTVTTTEKEVFDERKLKGLGVVYQNFFMKDFREEVIKQIKESGQYNAKEDFNWEKVWEVKTRSNGSKYFVYEDALLRAWNNMFGDGRNSLITKASKMGYGEAFRHNLVYVPRIEAADLAKDLFNSENITTAVYHSGDKSDIIISGKNIEDSINEFHEKAENDGRVRTFIFTSESLTTGVTSRYLSSVIILKEINSAELSKQIWGRPNTALRYKDRYCAVVLPKGQILQIISELALPSIMSNEYNTVEEAVRAQIDNMNILHEEAAEWVSISAQQITEEIINNHHLSNGLRIDRVYCKNYDSNMVETWQQLLESINHVESNKGIFEKHNVGEKSYSGKGDKYESIRAAEKDLIDSDTDLTLEGKRIYESLRAKSCTIAKNFPAFLEMNNDIYSIDDILNCSESTIIRWFNGISVGSMENMFEYFLDKNKYNLLIKASRVVEEIEV